MDHLPRVVKPHNPIIVPYLGGQYDGQDFFTYPQRCGRDVTALQQQDSKTAHEERTEMFMQTWLFFGMLHEFLETDVYTEDFVLDGEILTTVKLQSYLQQWKLKVEKEQRENETSEGQRLFRERVTRYRRLFEASYNAWAGFDHSDTNCVIRPQVSLSIQILASTLEHSVSWPEFIDIDAVSSGWQPWRFSDNLWLTNLMVNDGWCPRLCRDLKSNGHFSLLYFAHLLGPPDNNTFLQGRTPQQAHANCIERTTACVARNVDVHTYHTRHVDPTCDCEDFVIALQSLEQIVGNATAGGDDAGIALLSWASNDHDRHMILTQYASGVRYTAISHVWSDGLGNQVRNALPKCQLKRLCRLVEALPANRNSSEYHLWFDTFGVPAPGSRLRNAAISSMQQVYAQAHDTLVLDGSLLACSVLQAGYEEIMTRISACGWLRRLWTLQEALLPQNLLFQFADCAISNAALLAEQTRDASVEVNPFNVIGWHCDQYRLRYEMWSDMPHLRRVYMACLQLRNRATSRISDEPVCLAVLVGLTSVQILAIQAEQDTDRRCATFWRFLSNVPAAVLFLPGERNPLAGFGWSPRSLMQCGWINQPGFDAPAQVAEDGSLETQAPAVLLDEPSMDKQAVLAFQVGHERFSIRQNIKYGRAGQEWDAVDAQGNKVIDFRGKKLAVLLALPPGALATTDSSPSLRACIGALVEIMGEEDDPAAAHGKRTSVKYLRFVSVIGVGTQWDMRPDPPWSELETAEKTTDVLNGQWVREEAAWRVY